MRNINKSSLKKNEEKLRIKKVGNINLKDEDKGIEIKMLSSQKVIEKLKNEVLNHEIKIS